MKNNALNSFFTKNKLKTDNFSHKDILTLCISALQDHFNIDKWQINQPIILSDIQSKLIVDNKAVVAAADPKSVILRSSLILGPPTPLQNGCKKGSFPSFLQFIESRLRGNQSTDYFVNEFRSVVHINDVLLAIKHFLLNLLRSSETCDDDLVRVFNLGGSTCASRYDIALAVSNQLKLDPSSANGVNRPISGGGVPSPPDISMNVDKITAELSLMKMMGLNDIVSSTFHAYNR